SLVARATILVLSRLWIRAGKHCAGAAALRFALRISHLLALTTGALVVPPLRISGRCLRRSCNQWDQSFDRRASKAKSEKPGQSYSASVVQRFLLFTSHLARTGEGAPGSSNLIRYAFDAS